MTTPQTIQRTMRTTALLVQRPHDFSILNQQFQLVRYSVPSQFRFWAKNDGRIYGRLHNALKEQCDQPYYFYSYDTPEPGIYMLYPRSAPVAPISLPFLAPQPLPAQVIPWEPVDLHIILKLLQAHYFKSKKAENFVAQSKAYIVMDSTDRKVTCLEIALKGVKQNRLCTPDAVQTFTIESHTTRFIPVTPESMKPGWIETYPYFWRMSPKRGQSFLSQLNPSEVATFAGDLYRILRDSAHPARLDYHRVDDRASRGKTLYRFLQAFTTYLTNLGFTAQQRERTFTRYVPPRQQLLLDWTSLGTIHVLDHRLNQQDVPLDQYVALLQELYPQLTFVGTTSVPDGPTVPLVILLDYRAADFKDGGVFAGQDDPYQVLYRQIADRPRQAINVNPHSTQTVQQSAGDYLRYPLIRVPHGEKGYGLRFTVALNELYMKCLVLRTISQQRNLPGFPAVDHGPQRSMLGLTESHVYAFVRKQTYAGVNYHTLLYVDVDGAMLRLVDLRDPAERAQLYALLDQYGLDWDDDVLEPYKQKHLKSDAADEDSLVRYDFILGPGTVIELDDVHETVLYDYAMIEERRNEYDVAYPIAYFKLSGAPTASTALQAGFLDDDELDERIDLDDDDDDAAPAPPADAPIMAYNAFVDRLAQSRSTISFNQLTGEGLMHEIAQIFGLQPTAKGTYSRKGLLRAYQREGKFLSPKGSDVQAYSHIWYDDAWCYMVGSPQSIKDDQAYAQRIRCFDVYRNPGDLTIQPLLAMLAVQFVRPKQYTVVPYFFHLIDIYVQSVLAFQETQAPPPEGEYEQ